MSMLKSGMLVGVVDPTVALNPMMSVLIAASPGRFLVGKRSRLSLGTGLLFRFRRRRMAASSLWLSLLHVGIVAYHPGYGGDVI